MLLALQLNIETLNKASIESAVGTDQSSPAVVQVSSSDSASGAETSVLVVSQTVVSETGSGVDAQSLSVATPSSDLGSGSETNVLAATYTQADQGSGLDAGHIVAYVLPLGENANGSDVASENLAIARNVVDVGAGTDALVWVVGKFSADAASGTEASTSILVQINNADMAAGADVSSTQVTLSDIETGSMADALAFYTINGVRILKDYEYGVGRELGAFFLIDVFQTISAQKSLMLVRQEMVV